jgi:hypothetical protein
VRYDWRRLGRFIPQLQIGQWSNLVGELKYRFDRFWS